MAKRPCGRPGCPNLVDRGYCQACSAKRPAAVADRFRKSATERGYGSRWRKTSAGRLAKHPLCEVDWCPDAGIVHAAEVTDHIVAHKGDMVLFWDPYNWQSLCRKANSLKAVREEGGFGHQPGRGQTPEPSGG